MRSRGDGIFVDQDGSSQLRSNLDRTFREAIEAAWPGARITWALSWLALHDERPQYRELHALIVSYQKNFGDEITFIPCARRKTLRFDGS
jgi:hypothetical protein